MSAEAWAWIKGMKAEGLRGGGIDDLPDVEIHAQAQHLEFVDQRDVDAAVNIFEQFRHFRGCGRRNEDGATEDRTVERGGDFTGLRVRSANHFRNVMASDLRIAGIFALRRKSDPDIVVAGFAVSRHSQAGFVLFLENRHQNFFRRARIGSALENHDLAGPQVGSDGVRGVGNKAEIGLVILVERRRDADDDRVHGGDLRVVRGGLKAVGLRGGDFGGRDAENVSAAIVEGIDLALIDIETGYSKFLLAVKQGQRQSNVA